MRHVHVIVHGRVQGVGYRFALQQFAQKQGLTGWVRNRRDDAVEAVLVGDPVAVDTALAWMEQGPAGAEVTSLETAGGAFATPLEDAFQIRPNA